MNKIKGKSLMCFIVLLGFGIHSAVASGKVYYRYLDANGVKVSSAILPAGFAQKGYEIVAISGEVIKKVPPAMSQEERARKEYEQKLLEEYAVLKKRYSSGDEIRAMGANRQRQLKANIDILTANADNLDKESKKLADQLKSLELTGRADTQKLKDKKLKIDNEKATIAASLADRIKEQDIIDDETGADVELFLKGQKLEKDRKNKAPVAPQK